MKIEDIFQIVRLKEYRNYDNVIDSVDINIVNEDGQSLLHEAIVSENEYVVKDLLNRGIDTSIQDNKGLTPLHYAVQYGNIDIIEMIIENIKDINLTDEHGNNPLWTATFSARGNYKIVQILLDKGGIPNMKNKYNKSSLDFAKQINDKELIRILEKKDVV
ncbi:MAG: ankyrin repeat domain-containing protein [Flavobacteriaceae bacterium]|nr:ankyrin repeat domain-containing protein [Flavobacteriaceae bacterium]